MTYTNTFNISGVVIANGGISPGWGLPIRTGILIRYGSNGRDVWCSDDQSISSLNDWD